MFSNFRKAFKPTLEERKALYQKLNSLIYNDIEENGHNCRTCKYSKQPENNPYDCGIYCQVSEHVTESYETYKCDKYLFQGFFKYD